MMPRTTDFRAENRSSPWKRRLRIVDMTVVIALLSVDLALLRAAFPNPFYALAPLLGLLLMMVGFVRRYVPRGWDRPGYVAALILYVLFLLAYSVACDPVLGRPLFRSLGIQ